MKKSYAARKTRDVRLCEPITCQNPAVELDEDGRIYIAHHFRLRGTRFHDIQITPGYNETSVVIRSINHSRRPFLRNRYYRDAREPINAAVAVPFSARLAKGLQGMGGRKLVNASA